MKKITILFILHLLSSSINAQVTLYSESFETNSFNINYVLNRFSDGGQDYFGVVDAWGNTQFITENSVNPFTFQMTNLDGSNCIGAEDLKRQDNPLNTNLDDYRGYFIAKTIDASAYAEVEIHLLIGTRDPGAFGTVEANDNDAVRIQYAFDSDIATGGNNISSGLTSESTVNTGNYTDIGRFSANAPTQGSLQLDTDLDGTPDGAILNNILTEYVFTIPVTGTNLSVRIHMDYDDSAEEVAFDNLRLIGVNPLSISENNLQIGINIYPNPIDEKFSVSFNKEYANVEIKIINTLGEIINTQSYKNINGIDDFIIKGEKGIYFIQINADNSTDTFKIIKK